MAVNMCNKTSVLLCLYNVTRITHCKICSFGSAHLSHCLSDHFTFCFARQQTAQIGVSECHGSCLHVERGVRDTRSKKKSLMSPLSLPYSCDCEDCVVICCRCAHQDVSLYCDITVGWCGYECDRANFIRQKGQGNKSGCFFSVLLILRLAVCICLE